MYQAKAQKGRSEDLPTPSHGISCRVEAVGGGTTTTTTTTSE